MATTDPVNQPLLGEQRGSQRQQETPERRTIPEPYIDRVLLIAFTVALGMAATAATTVFAYAHILCADPSHCQQSEQNQYSSAVAVAAGLSNFCGVLTLGPLQSHLKGRPKAGLIFWLGARSLSVGILLMGVLLQSISLAIVARVFEGLATDNLLHCFLGAIYILAKDEKRFSRLMGTSLALYMVGTAGSPTLASTLPNFQASFVFALGSFALSLAYLIFLVPTAPVPAEDIDFTGDGNRGAARGKPGKLSVVQRAMAALLSLLSPLRSLTENTGVILPAMTVSFFNATQSYQFPMLMVYTSLNFGFTSKENGYLLSIAAGTSALYLVIILHLGPLAKKYLWGQRNRTDAEPPSDESGRRSDSKLVGNFLPALLAMIAQFIVLVLIPGVRNPVLLYPLMIIVALGLSAPSFLKSYGVSLSQDRLSAITSLAMMESIGGLSSVVLLGSWQSWIGDASVFYVAGGLVACAICLHVASLCAQPRS